MSPYVLTSFSDILERLAVTGELQRLQLSPCARYTGSIVMCSVPLKNYLRTYRLRAVLTQDEVAFLLGLKGGTNMSRHESNERLPILATAIAYEVVLGAPVSELFAGTFYEVREDIGNRTELLIRKLDKLPHNKHRKRTLAVLAKLLEACS